VLFHHMLEQIYEQHCGICFTFGGVDSKTWASQHKPSAA